MGGASGEVDEVREITAPGTSRDNPAAVTCLRSVRRPGAARDGALRDMAQEKSMSRLFPAVCKGEGSSAGLTVDPPEAKTIALSTISAWTRQVCRHIAPARSRCCPHRPPGFPV